mgnify:FL=1
MGKFGSNITNEKVSSAQREERYRKLINVQIKTECGRIFSAIATNISSHGMGGKTAGLLGEREKIKLTKEGFGKVKGEVRWVDGQRFGMLFFEPITVEQFNFFNKNGKGHFVPEIDNGHVWKGFDIQTSIRRPGFTSQLSRKRLNK